MAKSFSKVAEISPKRLLIVDSLNLAFRYKHAKSTQFVDDYIRVVESMAKSYKSGKVIIACDQGSSSYRKEIYPEYKANRKEKFANQTEEEAREFEEFFQEFTCTLLQIAEGTDYPVLQFDKVEADDIAAYIIGKRHLYDIEHTWLISSDRDWDLLIADDVSRFSYVTRKETRIDNWAEHYDCSPEEYISIKCLTGDSGDNIPGIDSIGPVRAAALVKQYGTAFDIADAIPIASKYKYIQKLNQCKDLILLNYQLMDLVTYSADAVGVENTIKIDEVLKEYLSCKS